MMPLSSKINNTVLHLHWNQEMLLKDLFEFAFLTCFINTFIEIWNGDISLKPINYLAS